MAAGLAPSIHDLGAQNGVHCRRTPLFDPTTASTSITNTGATYWADVAFDSRITINVVNGATNSYVIEAVEGSLDGTNFFPVPNRAFAVATGIATSFQTGDTDITVTAGATWVIALDPTIHIRYVRLNTKTANALGTAATVYQTT